MLARASKLSGLAGVEILQARDGVHHPTRGAVDFDGTSDEILFGQPSDLEFNLNGNPFSISFWIEIKTSGDGGIWTRISGAGPGIGALHNTADLLFYSRSTTGGYRLKVVGTATAPLPWQHVVWTCDGSDALSAFGCYLDSAPQVLAEFLPSSSYGAGSTVVSEDVRIGNRGVPGLILDNPVSGIRIFDRVLSAAEVLSLYTAGDVLLGGERAWWKLRGSGAVAAGDVRDSSGNGHDAVTVNGNPQFIGGPLV